MLQKKKPGNPKVAVAYIRVSTDRQELGPEAQREAIRAWAQARDIRVASWHHDIGVSGAKPVDERPGLLAAVVALQVHDAGLLVVARFDRLARDVMVAMFVEKMVKDAGAQVWSVAGEGNGDTPTDKLMRSIVAGFAEYERGSAIVRTKAALALKKMRGELTGSAPLGFRSVDGKLVRDADETAAIALARKLRATGMPLARVGKELEKAGFRSRKATRYVASQVKRMCKTD